MLSVWRLLTLTLTSEVHTLPKNPQSVEDRPSQSGIYEVQNGPTHPPIGDPLQFRHCALAYRVIVVVKPSNNVGAFNDVADPQPGSSLGDPRFTNVD